MKDVVLKDLSRRPEGHSELLGQYDSYLADIIAF